MEKDYQKTPCMLRKSWFGTEVREGEEVIARCARARYLPHCTLTDATLKRLAALRPKTLATMHGSVYVGDGAQAFHDLANIFREVLNHSNHISR